MSLSSRIAPLKSLARVPKKPGRRAQVGAFPNGELEEVTARSKSTSARSAVEKAQAQPDVLSLEKVLERERNLINGARKRLQLKPAKGVICLQFVFPEAVYGVPFSAWEV
jgi:hypothetical protein